MGKNFRSNICGKLFLHKNLYGVSWCSISIFFGWFFFFYLWVFLEKEGLVLNYCYGIWVLISVILENNLQGLPKSLKSQIVTRRVQFIIHIWDKKSYMFWNLVSLLFSGKFASKRNAWTDESLRIHQSIEFLCTKMMTLMSLQVVNISVVTDIQTWMTALNQHVFPTFFRPTGHPSKRWRS